MQSLEGQTLNRRPLFLQAVLSFINLSAPNQVWLTRSFKKCFLL